MRKKKENIFPFNTASLSYLAEDQREFWLLVLLNTELCRPKYVHYATPPPPQSFLILCSFRLQFMAMSSRYSWLEKSKSLPISLDRFAYFCHLATTDPGSVLVKWFWFFLLQMFKDKCDWNFVSFCDQRNTQNSPQKEDSSNWWWLKIPFFFDKLWKVLLCVFIESYSSCESAWILHRSWRMTKLKSFFSPQ